MNFKVVSFNDSLKLKAISIFNILNMKEAIHIQDVDFLLIDTETIDDNAIESYKNRETSCFLLFVVNNDEDIKKLLKNGFSNYIQYSFSSEELKSWCKFFQKTKKTEIIHLNQEININLKKSEIFINNQIYVLTKQEIILFKSLSKGEFVSTKNLKSLLKLNSDTSVRTLINRIKKKIKFDIFIQKRNHGYKLNIDNFEKENNNSELYIKELEEQNTLIQKIVDNSSVYIVTFIHKQLFCINKAFRDLLGNEVVKELWDEENGDFFQLIKHSSKNKEQLKKELFNKKTITEVKIYDFKSDGFYDFKVETYFFKKLDKHLLIFS